MNGEPIKREEFAQQVDFYRSRSNGQSSNTQNVNNAWNTLVREKIYQTQLEKSGGSADGKLQILDGLRKDLLTLEAKEKSVLWPEIEKNLKESPFSSLSELDL